MPSLNSINSFSVSDFGRRCVDQDSFSLPANTPLVITGVAEKELAKITDENVPGDEWFSRVHHLFDKILRPHGKRVDRFISDGFVSINVIGGRDISFTSTESIEIITAPGDVETTWEGLFSQPSSSIQTRCFQILPKQRIIFTDLSENEFERKVCSFGASSAARLINVYLREHTPEGHCFQITAPGVLRMGKADGYPAGIYMSCNNPMDFRIINTSSQLRQDQDIAVDTQPFAEITGPVEGQEQILEDSPSPTEEPLTCGFDHLPGQSFGQLRHPICSTPLLGNREGAIPSSRIAASETSRLPEFFDRDDEQSLTCCDKLLKCISSFFVFLCNLLLCRFR